MQLGNSEDEVRICWEWKFSKDEAEGLPAAGLLVVRLWRMTCEVGQMPVGNGFLCNSRGLSVYTNHRFFGQVSEPSLNLLEFAPENCKKRSVISYQAPIPAFADRFLLLPLAR
jgi:hypothetical protein